MNRKLSKELIELSSKLQDLRKVNVTASIVPTLELEEELTVPYTFKCEALHPGVFKGFTIEEQEIVQAQRTLFNNDGNFFNWEINKDHKSSRKEESSVSDVIGKIVDASYDFSRKALVITGQILDKEMALKVAHGLINFVSLRINPGIVEHRNGQKYARQLAFEEMSFVRAPGDPNARIISHGGEK